MRSASSDRADSTASVPASGEPDRRGTDRPPRTDVQFACRAAPKLGRSRHLIDLDSTSGGRMKAGWRLCGLTAALLLCLPTATAAAQNCVPKADLEAIVDDSGSMSFSDPNDLRIRAMELFVDTQGNERRTLGAVEFGSDATPLFAPAQIGPNAAAMKSAFNTSLLEDGGGTDYNA